MKLAKCCAIAAVIMCITSCASAPEFRCNGRLVVDDATGTYTCEAGERQ